MLEVGTGSGYQAAVLAQLAKAVYTIEIIEPLAEQAAQRLKALGYTNVQVARRRRVLRLGGTCAVRRHRRHSSGQPHSAAALAAAQAGRPHGDPGGRSVLVQQLMLVEKNLDGTVSTRQILPVPFVPLTGKR